MSIIYEALKKIEEKENKPKPPALRYLSKYILAIVVVILFVFFFSISIHFSRPKTKQKPTIAYPPSTIFSSLKLAVNKSQNIILPGKQEDKKEQIEYQLQGIIYDLENPIALINGKKVGIGDNIEGARLIDISDDGVELETKEGRIHIPW